MSQQDLADKVGVSGQTINAIENDTLTPSRGFIPQAESRDTSSAVARIKPIVLFIIFPFRLFSDQFLISEPHPI